MKRRQFRPLLNEEAETALRDLLEMADASVHPATYLNRLLPELRQLAERVHLGHPIPDSDVRNLLDFG